MSPKPPEFERTSTTLVNAYVGPAITRYVGRLQACLTAAGYARQLLLATSAGGVATPDVIARRPVATIGSGPTGGVVAAARAARAAGLDDVVSVDMGGTSYDVCLIRDGRPAVTSDWNWRHRYCIALPMVDIHAVGAGGGSIARADDGGGLHVGPESAGSEPGPVCYGTGGTEPTVTDADLLLGRLDPGGFWGGRQALDVGRATEALERLGTALGLSADDAAVAVVRIVDAHMTDAVRRVLALAGVDPRRVDLVAFGGMGAVHATTQAAALGVRRVLVPRAAPAFSALGLASADHVVDATRTLLADWRAVDLEALNDLADDLERAARAELADAGVPEARVELDWLLNLVYPGQTFDQPVPLPRRAGTPITAGDVAAGVEEFHRRNEEARLIEARSQEPMVRGVRLTATGVVAAPDPAPLEADPGPPVPIGRRSVHTGDGWHEVDVYDGERLRPGPPIVGPAVVPWRFTTLVLRPGDRAVTLPTGDVLVDVAAAG